MSIPAINKLKFNNFGLRVDFPYIYGHYEKPLTIIVNKDDAKVQPFIRFKGDSTSYSYHNNSERNKDLAIIKDWYNIGNKSAIKRNMPKIIKGGE